MHQRSLFLDTSQLCTYIKPSLRLSDPLEDLKLCLNRVNIDVVDGNALIDGLKRVPTIATNIHKPHLLLLHLCSLLYLLSADSDSIHSLSFRNVRIVEQLAEAYVSDWPLLPRHVRLCRVALDVFIVGEVGSVAGTDLLLLFVSLML